MNIHQLINARAEMHRVTPLRFRKAINEILYTCYPKLKRAAK